MIQALINGNEHQLEAEATLADVMTLLATTHGCAVAVNGEVVPKSAWDSVAIHTGDRVEILSAAPGG